MNNNHIENNVYFKSNMQPTLKKLPKLHKSYNDFIKKIEKSDFCNSARRYITELDFVQQLKKLYSDENNADLAKTFALKEESLLEKLKNDFGIGIEN